MRAIWVVAGVGVVVAAGAAMVFTPSTDSRDQVPDSVSAPNLTSPGLASGGRQRIPTKFTPRSMTGGPVRDPFAAIAGWEGGVRRAGEAVRTLDKPKPLGAPLSPNQAVTSAAQAPESARKPNVDARRPTTTGTGASGAQSAQAQRSTVQQAELERRKQQMEIDQRRREADARRRAAVVPGAGGASAAAAQARAAAESAAQSSSSSDPFANFDPNVPPSMEQIEALARAFGVDLGSAARSGSQSGSSSGSSGSNSGSSGGGAGGGGGGGTNNNPQTTDGAIGSSGFGGTPSVSARWLPVDNRTCGTSLAGFRTNDLYLRVTNNTPVTAVDSPSGTGLALSSGTFFQHPSGTNTNPTADAVASSACVVFDSFLNDFGVINPNSLGLVFSDRLVASWLNFAGVVGEQNVSRFGDNAFYVYLGRFTAPTTITNFAGSLTVGVGIPGVNFATRVVTVQFDSNLWRDNASFNTPGATTPGSGTPPGGGTPGGDTGGTPPADPTISLVWLSLNNNGCSETAEDPETGDPVDIDLTDFRTADLYVRSGTAFSVQFAASFDDAMPSSGPPRVAVASDPPGSFFQHVMAIGQTGLVKPTQSSINSFPCIAFDSFIAIDTPQTPAHRGVTVITAPGSGWEDSIQNVAWFAPSSETAVTAPGLFPNDPSGFYVRLARVTVKKDSTVFGTLDVGIVRFGQTNVTVLTLPACIPCWD